MKKFKNITIIFLLTVGLVTSVGQAKSPGLLLQEGLYAEETEGDLDKAIEIYEQVVAEAGPSQRAAARATYQLGMCYLKKGEEEQAAKYFQNVVSNYPKQKMLIRKASKQLAKVAPEITPDSRPFIVWFKAAEAGKITTARQLLDAFNANHPKEANTFRYRTETKNGELIGRIGVNNGLGKDKVIEVLKRSGNLEFIKAQRTYTIVFKPAGRSKSITHKTLLDMFNANHPKDVSTYYYKTTYKDGSIVGYISTDTEAEKDKLIQMIDHNDKLELVDIIAPETLKADRWLPLTLDPAPWVDGEIMELRLKMPAGNEYGAIIYSARQGVSGQKDTWLVASYMHVTRGNLQQYTLVEAERESFAPVFAQTKNWMGNFIAGFEQGKVHLETDTAGKQSSREIPVDGIHYDNEQALYLIRRMPLAEGYKSSFPIFTIQAGAVVECRIEVIGIEEVTVEAGTFECYKTNLSIYSSGIRTLLHTLWFSADEYQYLVKYDVGGAATMELAKVWQKGKGKPLAFENEEPAFSVTIPADWRFYSYGSGPQFSLQLIPPEIKAWAVLVWQKRGTDPDSESALTIAKADSGKLKGFFKNYVVDEATWKEFELTGLEAAQYLATYEDQGSGLQKYSQPKEMVEYRTYIVDESNVYWFVFRIEKDKLEENKAELDSIVKSLKLCVRITPRINRGAN